MGRHGAFIIRYNQNRIVRVSMIITTGCLRGRLRGWVSDRKIGVGTWSVDQLRRLASEVECHPYPPSRLKRREAGR